MLAIRTLKSAVLRIQCPVSFTSIPRRTKSSFYEYSGGKWLYNDEEQHLARYSPFNVQELYKTASDSVGARECTSMVKISKAPDSYSKIFRMTFDNGRTAIARIPLPPLLGDVSSVTAREVATAEFCRGIGLFGVPKVYAWSKDPSNPVGSAYIITEDVIGTPLSEEWTSLRGEPLENAITTITKNLLTLQIIEFSQMGSIYFKDDLPSELQSRPLFHNSFSPSIFPDVIADKLHDSAKKFRIGPIASSEWWRVNHDDPEADRGPWPDFGKLIEAAARLELRTLQKHRADPKTLRFSSSTVEDLDEIEHLLQQVLVLAPGLSATLYDYRLEKLRTENVLGLPEVLASNVIAPHLTPDNEDERMNALTYTHWQCAAVLPFPLHSDIPPIIRYEGKIFDVPGDPTEDLEWPSDMGRLSQEQQDAVRTEHHLAMRHKQWVRAMMEWKHYLYLFTHAHDLYPAIAFLPHVIPRACSSGPRLLRKTLSQIYQDWDTAQWGPCPIAFSDAEIVAMDLDFQEEARRRFLTGGATRRLGCDTEGWVPDDEYDEAKRLLEAMRTEWLAINAAPFPFTEGASSDCLS